MDDGLDLTNEADKALYDADRAIIAQLIAADADPDDAQWRHDFLQNVAAYRNALTRVQEDGGTYQLVPQQMPGNELATRPLVRTLIEQHRHILSLLSGPSVSTALLTAEARRYVTCVADVRNIHLEVAPASFLGGIEISGE
ncbi:hypothetical protein Rwratislav_31609 [Rhodococcus wratislaviensis IFP 2016]|nr:hypothetical protein Rwratislav_31609 [Rhodococcus wratislaviensis IFP 2016]